MALVSGEQGVGEGLGWALEHYVILKPIASGRFGSVYHARHVTAGHHVALKLIPRQGPDGDEKVAAERHGAMLQQRFSVAHKGLVPDVFEHGAMGGFYGIAMEFVEGQQLTDLLKAGPLPPQRAAAIALAICNFLERAHQFKTTIEDVPYEFIVHADLKPDHVLMVDDTQIRVLDFGIAKALEARALVTTNKWGSVQYASPERLQSDGHVDRHTDFWSLGVMLFEMAAGYRPYRRHEYSLSRLDRAIRTLEPPEPLPPETDTELGAVIRKLLAPQIERRYSSASAIAKDLEACLNGQPTAAGAELVRAGQETIRVGGQGGQVIPPPLPPLAGPQGPAPPTRVPPLPPQGGTEGTASQTTPAGPKGPALPPTRAKAARPSFFRRNVRLVVIGFVLISAARECSGLMNADRMRGQIGMLEPSDVDEARATFAHISGAGPFGLGGRAVIGPLKNRMIELADRTILDYRTEMPTVMEPHWQRARAILEFARELAPEDDRIAAKYTYVLAHLTRINAKSRDDTDQAIRQFRESARLDPSSLDPYLGLATMAAYATQDIEALRQAIGAAEARGYTSTRRERAQLGDVHKVLADRARNAARESSELRLEQLQMAAANYDKCIEYFDGLHYFESDTNLLTCRRRRDDVNTQIDRMGFTLSDLFDWQPR